MSYTTLLPSYYANMIGSQQEKLTFNNLYWFVGDGVNKDAVSNSQPKSIHDQHVAINQIIYGGVVNPSNVYGLIKKIQWKPQEVYSKYDVRDPNLCDKNFYVINSRNSVYKCLDNNNNSKSLYEPTTTETGPVTLADGYIWQYMYKISINQMLEHAIGEYIPIITDSNVTKAAVRGTITSIDITNPGEYTATNQGVIQSVASNTTFRISDDASINSGSYDSMGLYISSGKPAGTLRQIQSYVANTSGKWVTTDKPIDDLQPSIKYQIAPYVKINGNGFDGSARAIMNGTRIGKIEIVNQGHDYTISDVEIIANTNYTISKGEGIVNLSPIQGHGSNILKELYCNNLLIDINLDDYIIDQDVIDKTSFCKIGLIKNLTTAGDNKPYEQQTFNNTFKMQITPSNGSFNVGDTLTLLSSTYPTSKVLYADSTSVIGVYQTPLHRYFIGNNITNQNGVTGIVTDITNPAVSMIDGDFIALINTDTVVRGENSVEKLQIIINIR